MTGPHDELATDTYLGPLIETHGRLTIEPADGFFQRFVTSILRQQVSMASAAATRERLFEAVDVTPAGIRQADDEVLRDAGLSRQKTRYVNNVAWAFEQRGWSKTYFEGMDDDAVRAELTDVTGVGTWTANMQLLFSLGREDVFPVGDLGVRKGMQTLFDADLTRAEMVDEANRWRPYRSFATLYLWRIEEDIAESVAEVVGE
ncbi:DNA-3-methyladenine glycosylase family protein [Halorientalis regularis]|uniref:DNA-3-methyladenine glycosylase II n=1 Tax=Halorientalis regularis TaxID=660518 RepID=A0A1G7NIX0_9EURY|nr:DNA-3-methyladenine glycosylase [Halorientalis regularis]SDF73847.1 DNA-3-methyladenine glycosylase II [Halorientalis regularis]